MVTTFHVRGISRDVVVRAIAMRLREEGYLKNAAAALAGTEVDASLRRIVVVSEGDWVGLLDDRYGATSWGTRLSRALGRPVVELAGESHPALFSEAVLFERGKAVAASRVPENAVLGEDGRHRITPTFLASIVPEARDALLRGVIVDAMGGEANVLAVGRALGIARPQVCGVLGPEPGDVVLTFRLASATKGAPLREEQPFDVRRAVRAMVASFGPEELAALAAAGIAGMSDEEGAADVEAVSVAIEGGMRAANAPVLPIVSASVQGGVAGMESGGFVVSVSLAPTLARLRGLEIDVGGSALGLLAIDTMVATRAGETLAVAKARLHGGVRRFCFPEIELVTSEQILAATKAGNLLGVKNPGSLAGAECATVHLRVTSPLRRAGRGTVAIAVRAMDPAHEDVRAETTLEVRPPPRVAHVPAFAMATARKQPHHLEAYAARSVASGWVGFGAPWANVAAHVVALVRDLAATLRVASERAPSSAKINTARGERLTLQGGRLLMRDDPQWAKIEAELAAGAEVCFEFDEDADGVCTADLPGSATELWIGHRRDGALGGRSSHESGEATDLVRVFVLWSISLPGSAAALARLVHGGRAMLFGAGHVPGSLGGFVTAEARALTPRGSPAYESFIGAHSAAQREAWCRSHVRTPAWALVAPPRAAELLVRSPPERVWISQLTHGLLVASTAPNPFAYGAEDAAAMERYVLPAVGTRRELEAFRERCADR